MNTVVLYWTAHLGLLNFVQAAMYPYHTPMESGARDLSIDVQHMRSRAHSALVATARFSHVAVMSIIGCIIPVGHLQSST